LIGCEFSPDPFVWQRSNLVGFVPPCLRSRVVRHFIVRLQVYWSFELFAAWFFAN
jgi:hypothetical protein